MPSSGRAGTASGPEQQASASPLLSARLRDFAERRADSKTLQVVIYSVGYIFVVAILSFPLVFYQGFMRER